jgi:hypothetical protein
VLFGGKIVLQIGRRVQCAVCGDFVVAMRQLFSGYLLLYKSIASVAFVKGEFRLSLIFWAGLPVICVNVQILWPTVIVSAKLAFDKSSPMEEL